MLLTLHNLTQIRPHSCAYRHTPKMHFTLRICPISHFFSAYNRLNVKRPPINTPHDAWSNHVVGYNRHNLATSYQLLLLGHVRAFGNELAPRRIYHLNLLLVWMRLDFSLGLLRLPVVVWTSVALIQVLTLISRVRRVPYYRNGFQMCSWSWFRTNFVIFGCEFWARFWAHFAQVLSSFWVYGRGLSSAYLVSFTLILYLLFHFLPFSRHSSHF